MTLIFGAAVVLNRNPVASALSLVVSFLGLAALFVSLDAYFVGIIQVLVYAGAVMVLFLFIIMLLNLQTEERHRINWLAAAGGVGVALDIPLGHKDAAFVRSHFDGMEVRLNDAPRANEIMVAIAVTDSGRPLARVGGLTKDQIKGEDGLR